VDRIELLQPALTGYRRSAHRPWRLQSQIYVGFFGGALAIGPIAVANAVMLGMSRRLQVLIALVALSAEAALVALVSLTDADTVRVISIAAGLAVYGVVYLLQRSPDRVYHFHTRETDEYQSLLGPGIVAVIVGRIVESAILGT
jgi:hypothetical protein